MNEFKKRLAQQGGKVNSESASAPQSINGIPNSVLNDVFAGKRKATSEMMGHRTDLAPSVLGKMSQAFGMDFSGVQVYRSDAMAGTGMGGMAQGNKVVISSDVDLNTQKGQALLGHEFSHIRAQSMGIGTGNGLLQDAGLEHQADNEGLLAAQGRNIHGESMGMTTGLGMAGFEGLTPLSGGMSATAGAPMQAGLWDKLFGVKLPKNALEDLEPSPEDSGVVDSALEQEFGDDSEFADVFGNDTAPGGGDFAEQEDETFNGLQLLVDSNPIQFGSNESFDEEYNNNDVDFELKDDLMYYQMIGLKRQIKESPEKFWNIGKLLKKFPDELQKAVDEQGMDLGTSAGAEALYGNLLSRKAKEDEKRRK